MRTRLVPVLALALCWPAVASAQQRDKARVDFRVGFPAQPGLDEQPDEKGRSFLFKSGSWTPVYVDLEAGRDGTVNVADWVGIQSTDSEGIENHYRVPKAIPPLEGNKVFTAIVYTRPGKVSGEYRASVSVDGQTLEKRATMDALDPKDRLYVTVGSRLPGLRLTLWHRDHPPQQQTDYLAPRHRAAYLDDVALMPTRWFGYDAAEAVILTGGTREFLEALLADKGNRKEALAEWVRHGGHLVISAGRNEDVMAKVLGYCFPEQLPLGLSIKGRLQVPRLKSVEEWTPLSEDNRANPRPLQHAPVRGKQRQTPPTEIAKLERRPGHAVRVLIREGDTEAAPVLLAETAYGRGRVTLAAFDLDDAPFSRWNGQSPFWLKLLQINQKSNAGGGNAMGFPGPLGTDQSADNDLSGMLQSRLEQFADIPVISFGWVALFIFIYILVVGPLDYFFLKKVVKRLELTWITFPAVVITVSAVAYFAAYAIKGNDMKINKVDLVDFDLRQHQAYGNTWFTIFSPRIQHYTLGIEPAAPTWVAEGDADRPAASVTMSWMGRPDSSFGGYGQTSSQSLFRRAYDYAPDAAGLSGVPIQVWATKSFQATWERAIPRGQPPLTARIRFEGVAAGNIKLTGTVTNHLPVALEDVVVVCGRKWEDAAAFRLGPDPLEPGTTRKLESAARDTLASWVPSVGQGGPALPGTFAAPDQLMQRLMFYRAKSEANQATDYALPQLDESWRLGPNEAVVLGRVRPLTLRGQKAGAGMSSQLPTWLWMGDLPKAGELPPDLPGTLNQTTYVRFFVPVTQK